MSSWTVAIANSEQARKIALKYPFYSLFSNIIYYLFKIDVPTTPFCKFVRSEHNLYLSWWPKPWIEVSFMAIEFSHNGQVEFIHLELMNWNTDYRYDICGNITDQFAETQLWLNAQLNKVKKENEKWKKGSYV